MKKNILMSSILLITFYSFVLLEAGSGDSFAGGMAGGMFGGLLSGAMTQKSYGGGSRGGVSYGEFDSFRRDVASRLQDFADRVEKKIREIEQELNNLKYENKQLKKHLDNLKK
ncbi:hypothetical protein GF322_01555 [Candidatus Dependentiae bacterium]|nr:hypothetical protein [Candidatus Dependentiae bacterium]